MSAIPRISHRPREVKKVNHLDNVQSLFREREMPPQERYVRHLAFFVAVVVAASAPDVSQEDINLLWRFYFFVRVPMYLVQDF